MSHIQERYPDHGAGGFYKLYRAAEEEREQLRRGLRVEREAHRGTAAAYKQAEKHKDQLRAEIAELKKARDAYARRLGEVLEERDSLRDANA